MYKLILVIYFMAFSLLAQAQDTESDQYSLLLSEAKLFALYQTQDNIQTALIDSAEQYARQNDFELAIIFLEEYVQRAPLDLSIKNLSAESSPSNWELTVRTGIDFNRQEFELGFIESDSLISEQINKPFIGIDMNVQLFGQSENGIGLQLTGRGDSENRSLTFKTFADYHQGDQQILFEASYLFDKNIAYPDFSYNEINSKQKINRKFSQNWNGYLQNQLRYKSYNEASQTIPDFFRDVVHAELSHYGLNHLSNSFHYHMDYNESINYQNNDYFDQSLQWNGRKMWPARLTLDYTLGYQNNLFTYALEDSLLSNRAESAILQFRYDLALNDLLSWKSDYQGRYKIYKKKTEQDPDYQHHLLSSSLRHNLTQNIHLESGYLLEYKRHFTFEGAQDAYIFEQNYRGDGVLLGMEFFNFSRFMLSAFATYTWRRYPDALSDGLGSLYNDRNVLNFNLFLQAPLFRGLSINVFTSYDDDRDLDSDSGNIHHSIFSAELQYTF